MRLSRPLRRYNVTKLPHTCSIFEIDNFSDMHDHCHALYNNDTFLPPSPTGLYCATFAKGDEASDVAYDILNDTFKRVYQTLWKPNKTGSPGMLRFCLFKEKV